MLLWEYTTHHKTLNVLEFTSRFWYALIWSLCLSLELIDWKVSIHWWLWLTSVRRQFLTPRESGRIKITHNIICMCSHISSHFDLTCLFQVTRIKTYFVFLPMGSQPIINASFADFTTVTKKLSSFSLFFRWSINEIKVIPCCKKN